MSTRSTTHFVYDNQNKPEAIVYRHPDGYPEGAGTDLYTFLDEVAKLEDTRFGDPTYLAAKYVVFLADKFNVKYSFDNNKFTESKPESRLEFLSVGVMMEDPGDIEYRYIVNCGNLKDGRPTITCIDVDTGEEVEIPRP